MSSKTPKDDLFITSSTDIEKLTNVPTDENLKGIYYELIAALSAFDNALNYLLTVDQALLRSIEHTQKK